MSDPWVELQRVAEDLEWQDLFADMGIGRGLHEYERGKEMLIHDRTLNGKQYERTIKELAEWCEI